VGPEKENELIRLQLELESANEAFDSPEKAGAEVTDILFQVDRATRGYLGSDAPKGWPSGFDKLLMDRNGNTVGSCTFTYTEEVE
jgi:hypothetical protein